MVILFREKVMVSFMFVQVLLDRLEDLDFHLDNSLTVPEFLHYACIVCVCVCVYACVPFSFEILV